MRISKCSRRTWGHGRREQRTAIRSDRYPNVLRADNEAAESYFFFTRCVSALAATDLVAAGVLGLLSNLDALDATVLLVVSFDGGFLDMMVDFEVQEEDRWWSTGESSPAPSGRNPAGGIPRTPHEPVTSIPIQFILAKVRTGSGFFLSTRSARR